MPDESNGGKEDNLLRATKNLTLRVEALTGVVETNNREIARIRKEVNKKPDDAEIQFITGLAKRQRRRHLVFTIYTSIICSVLAGVIAYGVANYRSHQRCTDIQNQTDTIAHILSRFDPLKQRPTIQEALKDLNKERVHC